MFVILAAWFSFDEFIATRFEGTVVKVLDGDTIEVMHDGKAERIRLSQLDAPERAQPYGRAAKQYVLDLVSQQLVVVKVETVDRYGRTVGEVFLPDGENLNKKIVAAGYAWHYRQYSHDAEYGKLERQACAAGKGLWGDKKPIAPWDWRQGAR